MEPGGSSGLSEGHTQLYTAQPCGVCSTDEDSLAVIMKIPSHLEKKQTTKIELLQTKYICFSVAINQLKMSFLKFFHHICHSSDLSS